MLFGTADRLRFFYGVHSDVVRKRNLKQVGIHILRVKRQTCLLFHNYKTALRFSNGLLFFGRRRLILFCIFTFSALKKWYKKRGRSSALDEPLKGSWLNESDIQFIACSLIPDNVDFIEQGRAPFWNEIRFIAFQSHSDSQKSTR